MIMYCFFGAATHTKESNKKKEKEKSTRHQKRAQLLDKVECRSCKLLSQFSIETEKEDD